jgi:multidrug transporter EmrE-like cation transporter
MSQLPKLRKRFSGWRSGVMLCAITTGFVFLLNTIFTIYSTTKYEIWGGVSDLFIGSCSDVFRIDAWLHFAINVTSTMLLSASNCRDRISMTFVFADRGLKIPCKLLAAQLERKLIKLMKGFSGLTLEFLASVTFVDYPGSGY